MKIAVLDQKGVLIGSRELGDDAKLAAKDIPIGDLPTDGTYRWNRTHFIPVGFGFGHGKPSAPGVNRDRAIYMMMKALLAGKPLPQECQQWVDWYERNDG